MASPTVCSIELKRFVDDLCTAEDFAQNFQKLQCVVDRVCCLSEGELVDAFGTVQVCEGENIELIGVGGCEWEWTGPCGFTSNLQSPIIESVGSCHEGLYKLIATDKKDCKHVRFVYVFVRKCCNDIDIEAIGTVYTCIGENATFNILIEDNEIPRSVIWEGPDGFSNSDLNPSFLVSTKDQEGIYTATIYLQDCEDPIYRSIYLTVGCCPSCTVVDGIDCCVEKPLDACDGSIYIDLVEGIVETFCDGEWIRHPFCCPTVNVDMVMYVPDLEDSSNNSPDNYNQFVIGSDGNGYYIDSDGDAIALGSTPTVTEDTAPSVTLPSGSLNEGDVYVNTTVGESYVYDGGNWILLPDCCPSINQDGPITPPDPNVCDAASPYKNQFVTDSNGAIWYIDNDGCALQMQTPPDPCSDDLVYAAGSTLVCAGETIELFAEGGTAYAWTGPSFASSAQNPTIPSSTPAMSGLYQVDITTDSGCISRRAVYVRVIVCPPPVAAIDISCDV